MIPLRGTFVFVVFLVFLAGLFARPSLAGQRVLLTEDVSTLLDPAGWSERDLVARALAANADLAAGRLEIDRARGRLTQAGLLPNPVFGVEQKTGRWTGSAGESELEVGVTVPLELGGKRGNRIDLARSGVAVAEAEVQDDERRLALEVRNALAETLAAWRALQIAGGLHEIDLQTVRFIEVRVMEGDAPPLELSLAKADADRLASRRLLMQGRLGAALLKLKALAGVATREPLTLRDDLAAIVLPGLPPLDTAVQAALESRPDLHAARLREEAASAGLNLARSESIPDVELHAGYAIASALFDQTPIGPLRDRDKVLTFGVSIGLPLWNRNQGAGIEAQAAVRQARARREFLESQVRVEVAAAYARYAAAREAVDLYGPGVIDRSEENVRAVRGAYEVGAFRLTDLLNEQRRLLDSQLEYTDALAERYRALADVEAAIGSPISTPQNDGGRNEQ